MRRGLSLADELLVSCGSDLRLPNFLLGKAGGGRTLTCVTALRYLTPGVLPAAFILSCLPAQGLQIIPLPVETLSSNALLIVHGVVLSKTVQRDTAGRIYTSV